MNVTPPVSQMLRFPHSVGHICTQTELRNSIVSELVCYTKIVWHYKEKPLLYLYSISIFSPTVCPPLTPSPPPSLPVSSAAPG